MSQLKEVTVPSTEKLKQFRIIEKNMVEKWEKEKTFCVDAPVDFKEVEKFMCTFPYAYMKYIIVLFL
jgi:leucyl-tRNA synthetase